MAAESKSFKAASESLSKLLQDEIDQIHKERAELEAEKADWLALADKLEAVQIPEKIKLDVGGQIFATTITTLTKIPNSFFGAMFSGRWPDKRDQDGCFFIDRDPSVFGMVIQFLRDYPHNKIVLSSLSLTQRAQLREDAEYYQLKELLDSLHPYVARYHLHSSYTLPFIIMLTKIQLVPSWHVFQARTDPTAVRFAIFLASGRVHLSAHIDLPLF